MAIYLYGDMEWDRYYNAVMGYHSFNGGTDEATHYSPLSKTDAIYDIGSTSNIGQ
jgi:hypothetical protein